MDFLIKPAASTSRYISSSPLIYLYNSICRFSLEDLDYDSEKKYIISLTKG